MKNTILLIALTILAFSCSETKEQTENQNATEEKPAEIKTENPSPSADYGSLFSDFSCTMTAAEVAQALNIPESDVSVPSYQNPKGCSFVINGFGKNALGDETIIGWFLEETTKAQVKSEIQNYLDLQENNSKLGMGIEKSETGDTYLATSPGYGRVVILNENYDNWLLISYSPKHLYKTRTDEQHAALGAKMIDLANYLLKKNKK